MMPRCKSRLPNRHNLAQPPPEAQVFVQPVPDVVAIKEDSEVAALMKHVLQGAGHRGLAAAAQAGEPQDAAALRAGGEGCRGGRWWPVMAHT